MRKIELLCMQAILAACVLVFGIVPLRASEEPLRVCATVPELGDLTRIIGGDHVSVKVFAKGAENPHMVEAKPSFIKELARADLLVLTGMELEVGWVPALLKNARNASVQPGGRGYLDASTVIEPLEVPTTPVNRSMGDVHASGNPHYLLDPIGGLRVAGAIRDKLTELRPLAKDGFAERYAAFKKELSVRLAGETLAAKYEVEKMAVLARHGKLVSFLKSQNQAADLGGWFAQLAPHAGAKLVADHNLWPYFAQRFGLQVVEHLEPRPGLPPTSKHLVAVLKQMKKDGVRAILASPYYDERHANLMATQSGAKVARMCNQCGAIAGTEKYFAMIDHNVKTLATALGGRP